MAKDTGNQEKAALGGWHSLTVTLFKTAVYNTIPNIIPTSSVDMHRHTDRWIWDQRKDLSHAFKNLQGHIPHLTVPFYQILNEQNEVRKAGQSTQECTTRKRLPAHSSMWHPRQGLSSVPITEPAMLLPKSSFMKQPPKDPSKTSY